MDFRESRKILAFYKLPVTQSRLEILSAFLESGTALHQAAITQHCVYKPDRATIYRNLQVLVGRGVLHAVPSADGNIYYALRPRDVTHYHEQHVHFCCTQCRQITCLPEVPVPETIVLKGFETHAGEMILQGICKTCNEGTKESEVKNTSRS